MSSNERRRPSLAEIGVRNRLAAGDRLWKATRASAGACAFIWALAQSTRELGRAPTQSEFAKTWGATTRTVEREFARCREVWGEDVDVQGLADWLVREVDAKLADRGGALNAPSPGWLVAA